MCTGVGVYDYILYGYGLLGEVEREINRRKRAIRIVYLRHS